jgi:hypothetical protein
MKKFSDVFKSIRFAKLDPQHDKGPKGSSDDEEHYTVGTKEWDQQVKHVKKRSMQEEKKDKYDEGEYDQEGDMAKSDLRSIIANAKRMHDMIDDSANLPEWVQSKITVAEDYISTVANYMTAEMNEAFKMPSETVAEKMARSHAERRKKSGLPDPSQYLKISAQKKKEIGDMKKEEVELSEGRPSQRHPLEGHDYHKKSNAELIGIAKDAHAAAEAMKSHSPTAENKYRDQANDSATVRYFRQKSGMPDWYKKKYGHVKEEVESLDEKNVPTSPEKWAQAKAQAKAKFDVYPSAYANGWASKKYKEMGGGWKSVSEESISESRKSEIIKKIIKKKTNSEDKFEPNPVMSKLTDKRYQ